MDEECEPTVHLTNIISSPSWIQDCRVPPTATHCMHGSDGVDTTSRYRLTVQVDHSLVLLIPAYLNQLLSGHLSRDLLSLLQKSRAGYGCGVRN